MQAAADVSRSKIKGIEIVSELIIISQAEQINVRTLLLATSIAWNKINDEHMLKPTEAR